MAQDITTGAQTVTTTGAVTGTLDTSTLTSAPLIRIDVSGLTAGSTARIAIEDTANSSAFSDASQVGVIDLKGAIQATTPASESIEPAMAPSLRYGAANNKLRANVLQLTGSSPSLTVHAYIQ